MSDHETGLTYKHELRFARLEVAVGKVTQRVFGTEEDTSSGLCEQIQRMDGRMGTVEAYVAAQQTSADTIRGQEERKEREQNARERKVRLTSIALGLVVAVLTITTLATNIVRLARPEQIDYSALAKAIADELKGAIP
jgi:hypothetical protein